jgi:hypothetical protein
MLMNVMDVYPDYKKFFMVKQFRLATISFLLIIVFKSVGFSQNSVTPLINVTGQDAAWVNNIKAVDKNLLLIDGLFQKRVVLGTDTLRDNGFSRNFVVQYENGKVQKAMSLDGRVLGVDKKTFCVVGSTRVKNMNREWLISKFDLDQQLIWKYSLSLTGPDHAALEVDDICFDKSGNTYLLFRIEEGEGEVRIDNDVITGPTQFVVKLDEIGKHIAHRRVSASVRKLKIKDERICAYGGHDFFYHAVVFNLNLTEELKDNELSESCRYSLIDKSNWFRIVEDRSRPNSSYRIEKFNRRNGGLKQSTFAVDTVAQGGMMFEHEVLNFNKKQLVVVYVTLGSTTHDVYKKLLNVLVVRKKDLAVARHLVIECERLYHGTTHSTSFEILGDSLIIGNDYTGFCRIGNVVFGNTFDKNAPWSFFMVAQPLR